MKKIIALILCFVIFLTGCSPSANKNDDNNNSSATNESKVEELDIEFTGMNDDALLNYVEDMIYTETVNELNSDEYVVEEVRAVYLLSLIHISEPTRP